MEIKEIFPYLWGLVPDIIFVFSVVANVIGSWSITVMAILTGAIISIVLSPVFFMIIRGSVLKEMNPVEGMCSEAGSSGCVKSLKAWF